MLKLEVFPWLTVNFDFCFLTWNPHFNIKALQKIELIIILKETCMYLMNRFNFLKHMKCFN